ncbi:MAG: hypothetical protein NT154_31035 [Verrucomicrobia bacterium]|nr:hypothetical protein [Verrucomicrobiota bacterium]
MTPGTYDFFRKQEFPMSAGGGATAYERRTIVINSGQAQNVNMVRTTGWRVRGRIAGLDRINVRIARLYVRSESATGGSRHSLENLLPTYDALAYPINFGKDGTF